MFNCDDIIEFMNKIINQTDIDDRSTVQNNLVQFRNYLELTKMCDKKTLDKVDKVMDCMDSIFDLKSKLGFVDVTSLFNNPMSGSGKRLVKRIIPDTEYEDKHYRHYSSSYHDTSYSSGCGGGGSSRSGC